MVDGWARGSMECWGVLIVAQTSRDPEIRGRRRQSTLTSPNIIQAERGRLCERKHADALMGNKLGLRYVHVIVSVASCSNAVPQCAFLPHVSTRDLRSRDWTVALLDAPPSASPERPFVCRENIILGFPNLEFIWKPRLYWQSVPEISVAIYICSKTGGEPAPKLQTKVVNALRQSILSLPFWPTLLSSGRGSEQMQSK